MIQTLLLFTLFAQFTSYAITLDQAIATVTQEHNADEIIREDLLYKSNVATAIESTSSYTPEVFLFFNYSKPYTPRFQSETNQSTLSRFATGLIQENYGIGVSYNILNTLQLIQKIKAGNNAKSLAFTQKNYKNNEFIYKLTQSYIKLLKSEETLKLQKQILETSKTRYTELQTLFEYGRVSKVDMLRSYSEYLKSETSVEEYEKEILIAKKEYQDVFQVLHTNLEIPEMSLSQIAQDETALEQMISESNAIRATELMAYGYKMESSVQKLSLLPKITVGFRHTFTNPDANLSLTNYRQNLFSVNATLNLLNIGNYFKAQKYSYDAQHQQNETRILRKNNLTEAKKLWHNTEHQEKLIEIYTQIVKNTKETYNITQKEVKAGSKSFLDESLAKQDYISAELNLLDAKLAKVENIYKLKFLTSRL